MDRGDADEDAELHAFVSAFGIRALRGEPFERLGAAATQAVTSLLGVELAGVVLWHPQDDELELIAVSGEDALRYRGQRFPARPDTPMGAAVLSHEPCVVEDWQTETRWQQHPALAAGGIRSGMGVAIDDGDAVFGAIGVQHLAPRAWPRRHVEFLRSVANVLGAALARARIEDSMRHAALHDDLTGLPNRALLLDRLERALAQRAGPEHRVGVVFLDIDDFKVVNDALGHAVGDEVLRGVAANLAAAVRAGDTVARFGGDEFVAVCPGLPDADEAVAVAERLRRALSKPIVIGDSEHAMTASAGVTLAGPDETVAADALRDADAAMYGAKREGRRRTQLYRESARHAATERLELERALRSALAGGDIGCALQPIVAVESGDVVAVEALARWRRDGQDVPPVTFIALAEELGLVGAVGAAVLERAAPAVAGHAGVRLHVNLSPRELVEDGMLDRVAGACRRARLSLDRLTLEVTETALMESGGPALRTLDALRDAGIRLALDDFGVGHASLNRLREVAFDVVKLDRSLVSALERPRDEAMVDGVLRLLDALDVETVAEGVEEDHQLDWLRRSGCRYVQGYLLGRPRTVDDPQRVRAFR